MHFMRFLKSCLFSNRFQIHHLKVRILTLCSIQINISLGSEILGKTRGYAEDYFQPSTVRWTVEQEEFTTSDFDVYRILDVPFFKKHIFIYKIRLKILTTWTFSLMIYSPINPLKNSTIAFQIFVRKFPPSASA